jgi:hypothetical protein
MNIICISLVVGSVGKISSVSRSNLSFCGGYCGEYWRTLVDVRMYSRCRA